MSELPPIYASSPWNPQEEVMNTAKKIIAVGSMLELLAQKMPVEYERDSMVLFIGALEDGLDALNKVCAYWAGEAENRP